MNDLMITVSGWVATDPIVTVTKNGADYCRFRVGSTARYFDRSTGQWVNKDTEWFNVKVFRDAAEYVRRSVKKGQPVIVHGTFSSSEWETDEGTRHGLDIDARSVGHDLMFGMSDFSRAVTENASARGESADEASPDSADGDQGPADDAAQGADADAAVEEPAAV